MPKPVVQVGDDPDPSEWLFVSLEQKRIDQSKPYDAKKACWVPDEKEGYVLGEIKATKGELVTVGLPGGEVKPIVPLLSTGLDYTVYSIDSTTARSNDGTVEDSNTTSFGNFTLG